LKLDGETVRELSERCVPSAASKQIVIDGHDPGALQASRLTGSEINCTKPALTGGLFL
jgi:hypothetical protein